MKTLSFNDVPAKMEESDFAAFTFSALKAFFDSYDFEPDTMYVSKRIYEKAVKFGEKYLGPLDSIGKDAKLMFRGLHLVNTGLDARNPNEPEIELADIGEDIGEALKTRVKVRRLYKGGYYTPEQRLDFPTKVFRFWGIIPQQRERPLNFDAVAVIHGEKVVTLTGMENFPLSEINNLYEISQIDRFKL